MRPQPSQGASAVFGRTPRGIVDVIVRPHVSCVRGRSGGLLKVKRRCCPSEEAARNEQTPEPEQHPLKRGCHNGAPDPCVGFVHGRGHASTSTRSGLSYFRRQVDQARRMHSGPRTVENEQRPLQLPAAAVVQFVSKGQAFRALISQRELSTRSKVMVWSPWGSFHTMWAPWR